MTVDSLKFLLQAMYLGHLCLSDVAEKKSDSFHCALFNRCIGEKLSLTCNFGRGNQTKRAVRAGVAVEEVDAVLQRGTVRGRGRGVARVPRGKASANPNAEKRDSETDISDNEQASGKIRVKKHWGALNRFMSMLQGEFVIIIIQSVNLFFFNFLYCCINILSLS